MIDIKFIRNYPEKIKKACQDKQVSVDIDKLLKLDEERRKLIAEKENLKAKQNKASKRIAGLAGSQKKKAIIETQKLTGRIEKLTDELNKIKSEFDELMLSIPNPALPDVKVGKDESDNEILRHWGEVPKFDFKPKDHIQVGKDLDLIDTRRAGKVSGSRFGYLKNEAVLLQFAVINYALEVLSANGFKPILPPVMIGEKSMAAMGYLARGGEEETYHFAKDGLYLVGTSEQSIGPYYMDEVLDEKILPLRYVGYSTCFRREAGSYGKDTKGILRVHQFDKLEMFSFARPEDSDKEHEFLLSMEEKLVQGLEIPYRVVKMCTGDLGGPAARKYDIECWMPGQNCYRETHSTSTCTDFQARRLNIRYRPKSKIQNLKSKFVHTLNGTAFAIGRILIAILENYQQRDGSIEVPEVLQKYVGTKEIKKI